MKEQYMDCWFDDVSTDLEKVYGETFINILSDLVDEGKASEVYQLYQILMAQQTKNQAGSTKPQPTTNFGLSFSDIEDMLDKSCPVIETLSKKCECGSKHTSRPNYHLDFCPLASKDSK
jgi:hypothetical protein